MIVATIDEKIRCALSWKNVMSDSILRNSTYSEYLLTFNIQQIQHTIIRSVFVNSKLRKFHPDGTFALNPVH